MLLGGIEQQHIVIGTRLVGVGAEARTTFTQDAWAQGIAQRHSHVLVHHVLQEALKVVVLVVCAAGTNGILALTRDADLTKGSVHLDVVVLLGAAATVAAASEATALLRIAIRVEGYRERKAVI